MVKKKQNKKIKKDSQFWISIFILVIMVLSIAGFALISGGPRASSNGKITQDIPLQFYDKYGVWVAVKNKQEFIFKDINKYQNQLDLLGISNKIKNNNNLNIYTSPNYDPSSLFLFEKSLDALKIKYTLINNPSCEKDNNILLINSNKNISIIGNNCIKFITDYNQTYDKMNGLVYYLIK